MNVKTFITLAFFCTTSYTSSAQITPAKPATSLPSENVRIRQGVKSGEITPAERARLKAQERNIRREKREFAAMAQLPMQKEKTFTKIKESLAVGFTTTNMIK